MNDTFLIAVSALTVVGLIGWLLMTMLNYRQKYLRIYQARLENTDVDLEMATWDQLWIEIRKRREHSYILLKPDLSVPGQVTLNLEIHNIPPLHACGILKTASALQMRQLSSTPEGREFLNNLDSNIENNDFDGLPPWLQD